MPKGNPNIPPGPGRPKGSLNKGTKEAKRFFKELYTSEEYRASARRRIIAGKAQHLEKLGWEYYAGRPKLQLEHDVTSGLSEILVLALQKRARQD